MRMPSSWLTSRIFLCCVVLAGSARAYTPESPEVRAMITKSLNFLNKQEAKGEAATLGGHCIIGLAALKANKIPNAGHPLVQRAIKEAKKIAATKKFSTAHSENYSLGIAIIFLAEVDVEQYRREIQVFLAEILRRQQPGGGWGYHGRQNADISHY